MEERQKRVRKQIQERHEKVEKQKKTLPAWLQYQLLLHV